ncbi:exo-beta-N-acetylmuramidase NamZ domain-containing protein [Lacisediminihabitans sp.]|uniref:exo-beta-N-acetylmuramidase NamZ family protein n=1 Tax=Lacisediminihabitans sp. TaxID=2787631 RepID=UPI00374DC91C
MTTDTAHRTADLASGGADLGTGLRTGLRTGVSRLCANPALLPSHGSGRRSGTRRGLLTNFAATMPDLSRNIDALLAAGIRLSCLFGPEHGLGGSAQAGESEPGGVDERTGLIVHDTYLLDGDALDALLAGAGIDELLVDLRDFGARFGTYLWSMFDVMISAARLGIPVVVLDRPNPLGDRPAIGPGILPGFESFVGRASIPIVHSLTIGELAVRFNALEIPDRVGRPADLTVIGIEPAPAQEGEWVPPSPNLPTRQSVLAYPGTCLFEGTNVSEGRGTTRPFETVGAAWVDARFAGALRERNLPGVIFRELFFVPTFGKGVGKRARGVQLHIVDPVAFEPLGTGVTMLLLLADLYPGEFAFLPAAGGGRPFADLLWGSDALRTLDARDFAALLANSPTPDNPPADLRLYDRVSWNSGTSGSPAAVSRSRMEPQ